MKRYRLSKGLYKSLLEEGLRCRGNGVTKVGILSSSKGKAVDGLHMVRIGDNGCIGLPEMASSSIAKVVCKIAKTKEKIRGLVFVYCKGGEVDFMSYYFKGLIRKWGCGDKSFAYLIVNSEGVGGWGLGPKSRYQKVRLRYV